MADIVYEADLDDDDVLKALKRIDKNIDDIAKRGKKSFDGISKGAKGSGVVIGGVSGIVQKLVDGFVELGRQAARAFGALITSAIELNKEAELTKISVTQIFGGNEAAADAFLEKVRELSVQLGVSRTELGQIGKGILPDVGDVNQTLDLLKNVTILGRDAGQSFDSIRIALEESLSGNLSSLQRRLNIPASTIAKAERYAEQFGVAEGLARALQERVEGTGLSLDATADTLAITSGKLEGFGQDLLQIFGEQFTPELTEQLQNILQTLDENRDDIEAVAKAVGLLVQNAVAFIGTEMDDFINNIDFQSLEDGIDLVTRLVNGFRFLFDVIQAIANTGAADVIIGFAQKDFIQTAEGLSKLAQTDTADVMKEITDAFGQYSERVDENTKAIEKRREVVEDSTEADLEAANAYLKSQKALQDLAEAEAAAAEAIEKIQAKSKEFANQLGQELADTRRRFANQAIEDEIRAAERRIDIAKKNADALVDIERKNQQAIADASVDLSRDEEDIARKAARRRGDVDRELARDRLQIERDYRQELDRIRQQFETSAEDAERSNDVQAFLAAQRQQEQALESAKQARVNNVDSAKERAKEQRESLKDQLDAELEDARITNRRKLEDLQLRLTRELEEQALKNERAFQEQTIAEQRQADQRQRSFENELQEFAIKEQRRVDSLKQSLAQEFEAVAAVEEKKKELRIQQAFETQDRINKIFAKTKSPFGGGLSGSPGGAPPPLPTTPNTARAAAFVPPAPVVPQVAAQVSRSTNATFNVAQNAFDDPIQRQVMRDFVLNTMSEVTQ